MNAHSIVEAVLFASDAPLTADEIARADESLDEDDVEQALQYLRAEYDDAERSFQIMEVAEGWQILTRPEFAPYLERFDTVPRPSRLSGPALEALAIIAYRQPIGRVEVEYIRGVGSSGVIKTLQDRQLVEVVGRGEGLGRPLLYGTTSFFLEHFGFTSMEDLPRPDELPVVLRERVPLDMDDDEEEPTARSQEELALEEGDGAADGEGETEAPAVDAEAEEASEEAADAGESDGVEGAGETGEVHAGDTPDAAVESGPGDADRPEAGWWVTDTDDDDDRPGS